MDLTKEALEQILVLHRLWVSSGVAEGQRANLCGADLCRANLCRANLCGANLSSANLRGANLRGADLSGVNLCLSNLSQADLRGADLGWTDLRWADLRRANLSGADLRGANLRCAYLHEANLCGAKNMKEAITDYTTVFFPIQCPEFGSYTAFKKANGKIVELEIPADALRSSATSRRCRASKAKVISITNADGTPAGNSVRSDYDRDFVYAVGKTVCVKDFDTDRWNEYAAGIHHFITRAEAVSYE